jgi:DNA polymerase I
MTKELNLNSPQQIADFLYNHLKLNPIKETSGGKSGEKKASTDVSVITHYAEKEENEFCKYLLQHRKLAKAQGTYLEELQRWMQEGIRNGINCTLLHPDMWLNTTETVRSSASSPAFQTIPHHGEITSEIPWNIIRKIIVTLREEDYWLMEVDYEGAEVKTAANLSEDKQLIKDLNDGMDMHSHWTNVIFGWNKDFSDIKKNFSEERHITKNNWTFANIFGAGANSIAREFRKFDIYKNFVQSKWEQSGQKEPFFDFFEPYSEGHFRECQDIFFNRYKGNKEWQDGIVSLYYQNGYIETPLGFRRNYPLTRNEIINFPIQSVSFHILLDSIIRINKKLLTNKFKSVMIAQIHDSIMFLVYKPEVLDLINLVDDIMVNHRLPIPKKAKLGTEFSIGNNWMQMVSLPNK